MTSRFAAALAVCTLAATPSLPSRAAAAQQPEYETTRIADGVYMFRYQVHNSMFMLLHTDSRSDPQVRIGFNAQSFIVIAKDVPGPVRALGQGQEGVPIGLANDIQGSDNIRWQEALVEHIIPNRPGEGLLRFQWPVQVLLHEPDLPVELACR